jgi:hypothetical protein
MSVASPTGRVEGSRREAIRIRGLATSSMHPYRPFAARSLAAEVLTLVLALLPSPHWFVTAAVVPAAARVACLPACLSVCQARIVGYVLQSAAPTGPSP